MKQYGEEDLLEALRVELVVAIEKHEAAVGMKDEAAAAYDAACIEMYKARQEVMKIRRKIVDLENEKCPF